MNRTRAAYKGRPARSVVSLAWAVSLSGAWLGCSGKDLTQLDGPPTTRSNAGSNGSGSAFELASQRYAVEARPDAVLPHLSLDWAPCDSGAGAPGQDGSGDGDASGAGDASRNAGGGFECADALVPRDYAKPHGPKYRVAVTRLPARDPARRIGTLFFNFGGPGGSAVGTLQAIGARFFGALNERFDLLALDPRGVGQSEAAIDCHVDQETSGLYAQPYTTPLNLNVDSWTARAQDYVDACLTDNADVASIVSTANVARDMDQVRDALGEEKLSYLGFSYGSFLGATYASLFPDHYRALVLDGALDADQYINRPSAALRAQSAGFERAFGRFFQACAGNPPACFGFGGGDPHLAFDQLVKAANAAPMAVPDTDRVLDGDDILTAAIGALYSKDSWSFLARSLAAAANGDPALLRSFADAVYGREDDGSFDPSTDRYFTLSAAEQNYAPDLDVFLANGDEAFADLDHTFWNTGYAELPLGLFPVHSSGVFNGPFVASAAAPPVLVVATTYDPATPYRGSVRLVESLGNARLLTMLGDGHTAYGGNSPCIDSAVEAYLEEGVVPDVGTECVQDVPFEAPPPPPPPSLSEPTPVGTAPRVPEPLAAAAARVSSPLAARLLPRGRLRPF